MIDRVISPEETYDSVNERISAIVFKRQRSWGWLIGFALAFLLLSVLVGSLFWLFFRGVGIWGINIPVAWGFAIINYVWWIEIAQGGTFISAVLLLFHQQWRTSVNRFTEAVTLFALACAGLFPVLHLGRPQYAFYLMPYPNTLGLWPQFISPLVWDFFAVVTYGSVSILFWYMGLVPDLATLRDRTDRKYLRRLYSIMSFGWRNSARHWNHYETTYKVIAALAAPLVISVHSIVGLDFAYTIVPGWHSTIFPPFFVVGAIFSGFAMVLTLVIPVRAIYRLHNVITDNHLRNMAKMLLAMGMFVLFGHFSELFMAWFSGDIYDQYHATHEALGTYAPVFWITFVCNIVLIQLLWFKYVRHSPVILFLVAGAVNVGMWTERYLNVVGSLHRDYLPSSWAIYHGSFWDWSTFIGSMGLFLTLLFLFVRFLPLVSISEVRRLVYERDIE
ncbi:MAG TPA: NrfD/PsrC family molybdoenzyme membrane anchor subunit [Chthoniobacterales bacterium]|jgi:molybdopterin-containing oxidoreductase family membrane subunit